MKNIDTRWRGIRPLIMSNPQTVDVENEYAQRSRSLNQRLKAARKRGDEDKLLELAGEQKRLDFEASAYWDDEAGGFYVPDQVVLACLKNAATTLRKGKDIDRCVLVNEDRIPVRGIPEVKSLAEAGSKPAFIFETPAKVPPKTGAMLMKRRCMMPSGWELRFSLSFDESLIAEKTLRECMEIGGTLIGIGGWRPRFGRFLVEVSV